MWDNSDFLHEGEPFRRRANGSSLTHHFNTLKQIISSNTHVLMSEQEASNLLDGKHLQVWNRMVQSATEYLISKNLSWLSVNEPVTGPNHWGWSRIVSDNFKAKLFYQLLMTRPPDHARNPNEQVWRDAGLTTFSSERFEKVYRNLNRLRCNLRVKYKELRVILIWSYLLHSTTSIRY